MRHHGPGMQKWVTVNVTAQMERDPGGWEPGDSQC